MSGAHPGQEWSSEPHFHGAGGGCAHCLEPGGVTSTESGRCFWSSGSRLLADHGAPGSDGTDGRTTGPSQPDGVVGALLDGCGADLDCVAHSHGPEDRLFDTPSGPVHLLNPGSPRSGYRTPFEVRPAVAFLRVAP